MRGKAGVWTLGAVAAIVIGCSGETIYLDENDCLSNGQPTMGCVQQCMLGGSSAQNDLLNCGLNNCSSACL